jgi:hypothetical protein
MEVVSCLQIWSAERNMRIIRCDKCVEDKYWHFKGTSVLIYRTASQENHTTLRYSSYNKVLSHYYLFAVTGSLIWHTEENHVPTVDLKPPLLSVWNRLKCDWGNSDPLARTPSSWVWARKNILITLWTMNLQDSRPKRAHSRFGIKWGISCSQNASEIFKIQEECPPRAYTFSTLIQHML